MPRPDPVRLEICHHMLAAVCEEAGLLLQQSAVSPNIRERRDYSVAVFDRDGRLVAQAAHIPVHLGSAADAVAAARAAIDFAPGDTAILNDPYQGGTHLPDVTMIAPVFAPGARRPDWFVSGRAHHADIGGAVPGSMGIARDLHGEGLVIPPVLLRRRGKEQAAVLSLLLANVRGADERRLDLRAQEACLRKLGERLLQLQRELGRDALRRQTAQLMDYTERTGRAALRQLRRGAFAARDHLDDDGQGNGPLDIALRLGTGGRRLSFDFSRSAPQAAGGVNANRSVVLAACAYAVRCLCPERMPTNDGLFRLFEVATRPGTIVDPIRPAPVAGGNVETSQRLVDVCLQALARAAGGALRDRIPASSAGTMSNLSVGGRDDGGREFAFYETLAGGAGAGPSRDGRAAVQTHMTNTRNTPIEELEHRYPVRVERLTVRRGSGGAGRHRGGAGIDKVLRALAPVHVTFLGDRQLQGPPGVLGGGDGAPGELWCEQGGRRRRLASKVTLQLDAGDAVELRTPGGGGWRRGAVGRARGRRA
ncbi:MAG: hydantoinase B/oxoprolinase family protein [Planctomycetota bacterium]